jgi:thiol-disulfide isomerase/thioredoxin
MRLRNTLILALIAAVVGLLPGTANADFAALLGTPLNLQVFDVQTLDGESVKLPTFEDDKVYLIAFWHLDCVFCQGEGLLALQDEVYEVYNLEQLEVIAVNTDPDTDPELLKQYRAERGLTYPFYMDGGLTADELGILVPSMLVIDQDGILVYMETDKTFNAAIEAILEELGVEKVG